MILLALAYGFNPLPLLPFLFPFVHNFLKPFINLLFPFHGLVSTHSPQHADRPSTNLPEAGWQWLGVFAIKKLDD
jgi:hypothetical protein